MTSIQSQLDQVLAPCPFCGGTASLYRDTASGTVSAQCDADCFNTEWMTAGDAATAWNSRAAVSGEAVIPEAVTVSPSGLMCGSGFVAHGDFAIAKEPGVVRIVNAEFARGWNEARAVLYASPTATVGVGALRKALNDIREAVTQEPEDKFGYNQVDHGSGIPRAYSVRENILCTIDNRVAALIGEKA